MSGNRRIVFIDLFRSAVILLMLEGHLLRALLDPLLQGSAFFHLHEFVHGLSAPAFLFGAGLTFVISTRHRWHDYRRWGEPLSRRIRRLLLIYALGIGLHLPFLSIRKIMIDSMPSDILQLFACDVLHCIGIGLLVLHLLVMLFRTETRFFAAVGGAVAAIGFCTPFIWDLHIPAAGPWFAQMINGYRGSPFPVFPYLGFMFAGVLVARGYLRSAEGAGETAFAVRLFFAGSVLVFAGMLADFLPFSYYPVYNYWFTSPNYFIIRLGSLLILFVIFRALGTGDRFTGRLFTVLGAESLFVYVLHLAVLYGTVLNPEFNLQVVIGASLGIIPAFCLLGLFVGGMLVCALGWHYLKTERRWLYRTIQLAAGAGFLLVFFLRDF